MSKDLNHHLEMQYLIFSPIRKSYIENSALMNIEKRRQKDIEDKSKVFSNELYSIQENLKGLAVTDRTDITIKNVLQKTILTRMEILIPHKTGWDQACEFLELQ